MSDYASRLARRAMLVAWLVGVWVLLWGTWRPDVVVLGLLAAIAAVALARLPALPLRTDTRWARVPLLLGRLVVDMLRSSWEVAVATVRTGRRTRSSVLRLSVPPEASDTAVVLACNRISLEPGSIVVDVDRRHHLLFVYQLDTPDAAAAERSREQAQRLLDDVLATFPARRGPAPGGTEDGGMDR